MLKLHVEKMKCGGCVANVKQAIERLPGVVRAEVDLDSASARVEGEVDPQSVIETLNAAGYPASPAD